MKSTATENLISDHYLQLATDSVLYRDVHSAYIETLKRIYDNGFVSKEGHIEMFNLKYGIRCVEDCIGDGFVIRNKTRNLKMEFADKFFKWIMAGKTDPSELYASNVNAKKFAEIDGRNTAYGPRILAQLPYIIDELVSNPESRRAVINILDAEDKELLLDKRNNGSKMEFPCTISITFFIRGGKLHSMVDMRSNNMTTTICYDLYNFLHLHAHVTTYINEVASALNKYHVPYTNGMYLHSVVNAHIINTEIDLATSILAEEFPNINFRK